ncbi:S26 family signal peptidase [Halorubrum laminariae]|uniref:S26 family signal peptidase n=1 Tax=Halorubrum laminariae TaxID=1433523 RepID=A0ABD6C1P3_9EURY|nr:S26 family signal peptidase [Halorubrum laminariae]
MDEGDRTRSDEGRSDGTDLAGDDNDAGDNASNARDVESDTGSDTGSDGGSDTGSDGGSDTGRGDMSDMSGDGASGSDGESSAVGQRSLGDDEGRPEDSDPTEMSGRTPGEERAGSDADRGLWYRFRHDRDGALMWIREILSSVAIVLVIGLLLFGISGVWPPMVAVESGSMEPNMEVGDLVFVTEPGRLAPDGADNGIGVVTYDVGERIDYRTFGSYGSVVIYQPPGRTASPIIHRAMFHVEADENWYDRADSEYHSAESCADLRHCPAPHDGYITLGDNNGVYDQARGLSEPVKQEWVTGVARVRIPYLGYVRLVATGKAEPTDAIDAVAGASA